MHRRSLGRPALGQSYSESAILAAIAVFAVVSVLVAVTLVVIALHSRRSPRDA